MEHYCQFKVIRKAQPTDAQKEAGNYKKHYTSFQGLDISIENKKSSIRSGTDREGKTWSIKMKSDYGYIKGTKGKDKDHLDVFVGSNKLSEKVFIINQINKAGQFDEHKIMLGYNSLRQARRKYLENYEKGWKGLGEIKQLTIEELKEWLKEGNTMIAKTYTEVDCTHLCPSCGDWPNMVVGLEKADHPNQKHGKGGRYVKTNGGGGNNIDSVTETHLQAWLKNHVDERDRSNVETGIKQLVKEHPDLVERGDSWPEIRKLAERAGYIKINSLDYPKVLEPILSRVNYEKGKYLTSTIVSLAKEDKDKIDKWLVSIQHPLAYQPGTQNFRIEQIVKEIAAQTNKSQPIYIDISKSKSQLVRKPIVDKTGKRTTVWINPNAKLQQQDSSADHKIQYGVKADRDKLFTIAKERGLTIPPAWQNVWVNKDPQGKIQVTGYDTKGRKVYIRHIKYCEAKSAEKFERLKDFVKAYPKLVDKIKKDMKSKPEAACLYLISQTGFRIGGEGDTKTEKQAYGASTLLGQHVQVKGNSASFDFIGKKGVRIQQTINDPKIINVIGQKSTNGRLFDINPSQVRNYLKSIDGNFKVKDMRTHVGTVTALNAMKMIPKPANDKELKKAIFEVCKVVAAKLGNTPSVSKKYYIAPETFQQWEIK